MFSYIAWLPKDRLGQGLGVAFRLLASLAILAIIVGLAGLERPESAIQRTGEGAEILLLIDRSRSMEERMLPPDWRTIDPLNLRAQARSRGEKKSDGARRLLSEFVAKRPNDRYALLFFSANPIPVVPFTERTEVVQSGITAGGIGRGLSDTDVGRALIAAAAEFDRRAYSGSRIILLVSDGGAQLDAPTRDRIRAALLRNRIALYWFYLRSINGADLHSNDAPSATQPELALHRYFQSLSTPYQAYQVESPEELARAIADVDQQQRLPVEYLERIPHRPYSGDLFIAAGIACALLLGYRALQLRVWS
jgi:mxaC protein